MPWASYQIRIIAGCACAGNARNVFPRHWLQRKPLVSNPGMHHGTCVTHVPWCMSGLLSRCGGENVPGIPGACATRNFTYLARGPLVPVYCPYMYHIWDLWHCGDEWYMRFNVSNVQWNTGDVMMPNVSSLVTPQHINDYLWCTRDKYYHRIFSPTSYSNIQLTILISVCF